MWCVAGWVVPGIWKECSGPRTTRLLKTEAFCLFQNVRSNFPSDRATSWKTCIFNNMAMNTSNFWSEYSLSSSRSFRLDLARHMHANVLCLYTVICVIYDFYLIEKSWVLTPIKARNFPCFWSSLSPVGSTQPPVRQHHVEWIGGLKLTRSVWSWICGALPQLPHMPTWHGALLSTETSLPFPSHAVYANLNHLDTCYLYF